MQAYVFPFRNYDATTARWRSADPAGYPDGMNNQFYAGCPTIGLDLQGTSWGNVDFLYQFYFGNGAPVSLNSAGLTSNIENSAIQKGIKNRVGSQIQSKAESTAPSTGNFRETFNNSYNFGDVCYSIGNATMSGSHSGNLVAEETYEDGKTQDTFTDHVSLIEYLYGSSTSPNAPSWLSGVANLGGTPFNIYVNFSWQYSGTFEKMMR